MNKKKSNDKIKSIKSKYVSMKTKLLGIEMMIPDFPIDRRRIFVAS